MRGELTSALYVELNTTLVEAVSGIEIWVVHLGLIFLDRKI